MKENGKNEQGRNKGNEVKTFPIPFIIEEIKEKVSFSANTNSQAIQEKLINRSLTLHSQGNILEAKKYYIYCINQGLKDPRIFLNYGTILKDHGQLKEAKASTEKAIEIKPNLATAHLNLGQILSDLGQLKEAEVSTIKAIKLKPNFADAHYNLGKILKDLGQLKESIKSYLKAIEINPNYFEAHYNLGQVLSEIGQLKEAEKFYLKTIEINPNITKVYYSLSKFKTSENKLWQDKLFSKDLINNNSLKDKINIYFARANIHHNQKNYKSSSEYLLLANDLKLEIKQSNYIELITKSKALLIESEKKQIYQKKYNKYPQSIFIVGMPRCGSTLLESILSMNTNVKDLGEINYLEESFLKQKQVNKTETLAERYWNKVSGISNNSIITTNKNLYNYQYVGIIIQQIPNAKIIHCYRNPLDNILSIYRTHFIEGNEYSSSLVDCAKAYLDQEKIMAIYKNRFRSKIYNLNYDLLVSNPNQEIKSLIDWLGWKWNDSYLSPYLNPRSVSTASSFQVRSPINSKSLNGWRNYQLMLQPAIEIFSKTNRYLNILS